MISSRRPRAVDRTAMRLGGNEMEEMWGFRDDINYSFVALIFEQGYNCHFINVKIMFRVI
jgi:hypothetical protein